MSIMPTPFDPRLLKRMFPTLLLVLCVVGSALPAHAKNHLWRFTEFFSNADGTIQFVEMQECCDSDVETQMSSTSITSNASTYDFPNDLSGLTARRWILIATAGFAALPGAPTPDYIMPDGFFDPAGDTLRYRGVTDMVVLAPDALPLDGVNGLDRDITTGDLSVAVNSPINFAGDTGSVTIPVPVPIGGPWLGAVFVLLAGASIRRYVAGGSRSRAATSSGVGEPASLKPARRP